MEPIRFILTGGGTGGHVYPNIAIYEALKQRFPESDFLYLGMEGRSESQILKNLSHPIPFKTICSQGLPIPVKQIKSLPALLKIAWGTLQSLLIIARYKPHFVIASGGYVSAPVVLAAKLLKKKIFLHEQNSVPGRMNQMMARFADCIALTFASTVSYFPPAKTIVSGYPVRKSLSAPTAQIKEKLRKKLGIPKGNKVLFILSGSTGSRSINQAAAEIIPRLLTEKNLTVILSTGKNYSQEYKAYEDTIRSLESIGIPSEIEGKLIIREYFNQIEEIYAISDLVVSRAGAGSINEITALKIPSILIPKIDLPADHQIMNARELERLNAAHIIYEEIQFGHQNKKTIVPEQILLATTLELIKNDQARLEFKENLKKIPTLDALSIIGEKIEQLISKPDDIERELKVHYLHEPEGEINHELLFDTTSVGNTLLADIFLEKTRGHTLFKLKFLNKQNVNKIVLQRIKGDIAINGNPVFHWAEIVVGDRITANGRTLILNSFIEKVKTTTSNRSTSKKMIGSSLGISISRIGGFFREIVAAKFFGAAKEMDIFSVGLNISNLIRRVVAENAMENAFMPVFLRLFNRSSRKTTWKSASSIVNFTLLISIIFMIGGILLTPQIIRFLFPGLVTKGFLADSVGMTRIMFPFLFLVTIAAVMTTYLKAFNRFGLAEGSAVCFSIGCIAGIFLLHSRLGLYSLAWGVLFGGILQILFLIPYTYKILSPPSIGFSYSPALRLQGTANKKYYANLAPITADVTLTQITSLVDKRFASLLATGSLSYLYFAQAVFRLPFAVISQALSSVILKDFSENIALFDKERSKKLYIDGINVNVFLLFPISILMILLSGEIISIVYQRSRFDAIAVTNTAWVLQFYAIGLVGWGIHNLTMRIFAARLDIKTSMFLNFFMVLTNVGLCYTLVQTRLKFAGIALATSISYTLFSILRMYVLKLKMSRDQITFHPRDILEPLLKTLIASVLMIIAMIEGKMILQYIHFSSPFINNLIRLLSLSFIGTSVFFLVSLIIKNQGILFFKKHRHTKQTEKSPAHLPPFSFLTTVSRAPEAFRKEFRYKINVYLASSNWEIRNIGVKLIGIFQEENKIPLLLDILHNKKECAFIRRNALISLLKFKTWNEEIRDLILALTRDPYYEIRVAAWNYLTLCMPPEHYPLIRELLKKRLLRSSLEEKIALIRLLAKKGMRDDISLVNPFYLHANSNIREELLEMLSELHKRGLINTEELKQSLSRVLITSNSIAAEFRIKSIVQRILREVNTP